LLIQVIGDEWVICLDQILGHGQAHDTDTDKTDFLHDTLSLSYINFERQSKKSNRLITLL
jgi:hypothetical protein